MQYKNRDTQTTTTELVAKLGRRYSRDYLPIWKEGYCEGLEDAGFSLTRYSYNGGVILYVFSKPCEEWEMQEHHGFTINETLCTCSGVWSIENNEAPLGWSELATERPTIQMLKPNPAKGRFGLVKMRGADL